MMATMYGQDNLGRSGLACNIEEEDKEGKAGKDAEIMTEDNNIHSNKTHVNKDTILANSECNLDGSGDEEVRSNTEKENLQPKPRPEELRVLTVINGDVQQLPMIKLIRGSQEMMLKEDPAALSLTENNVGAEKKVKQAVVSDKAELDEGDDTFIAACEDHTLTQKPKTDEDIPTKTEDTHDIDNTITNTAKIIPDERTDNDTNESDDDTEDDSESEQEAIIMADMEAISEATPLLEVPETVLDIDDDADVVDGNDVADLEATICSGIDVFLYRIPVDKGLRLEKASEWDLSNPVLSGTLSLTKTADAKFLVSVFDDDNQGALYATMEFNHYPSPKLYLATDSTRYFIAALKNAKDGTTSAMGVGFYCSKQFAQALQTSVTPEPTFEPPRKRKKTEIKLKADLKTGKKVTEAVRKFVEAKYQCHFCSEDCKTKETLKKHWADEHGLRHPSHCPYCLDPFPSEHAMKIHRDFQHQHACNKCTLIFVNENEYVEHFYNTHGYGYGMKR